MYCLSNPWVIGAELIKDSSRSSYTYGNREEDYTQIIINVFLGLN